MKDGIILTPVPGICFRDCEKSLLFLRPGDAVTPDKQGEPDHTELDLSALVGEKRAKELRFRQQCFCFKRAAAAAAAAKSLQSCPTVRPHGLQPTRLLRPWDSPGKNTGVGCHLLLQCMKVEVKVKSLSCVRLLATPWTAAYQAPPSMGFSRQQYWSGVPLQRKPNRQAVDQQQ